MVKPPRAKVIVLSMHKREKFVYCRKQSLVKKYANDQSSLVDMLSVCKGVFCLVAVNKTSLNPEILWSVIMNLV